VAARTVLIDRATPTSTLRVPSRPTITVPFRRRPIAAERKAAERIRGTGILKIGRPLSTEQHTAGKPEEGD
jgi:hypothetical protein